MFINRPTSNSADLEQMLDNPGSGHDRRVAGVIAAATSPSRDIEIAGLDAALTAFASSQTLAGTDDGGAGTGPVRRHLLGLTAATLATKLVAAGAAAASW